MVTRTTVVAGTMVAIRLVWRVALTRSGENPQSLLNLSGFLAEFSSQYRAQP